ncbi:MAG: AAA family ATPase [Chitinophagaceae bacterium]
MDTILKKTISATSVFGTYYLDSKAVYMYFFNDVPCISFVSQLDGEKAFAAVKEKYGSLIETVYQYRHFERVENKTEFNRTLLIFKNGCLLEFDAFFCEVLYNYGSEPFVDELVAYIRPFREKKRRKPQEINLVMRSGNYLDLKSMAITKTKLDLDLFYEDDFKETDEIIRTRLNRKNDKGIVLLHGLPGTGKTTYLRHLAGKIRKRIMFLSPNMAGNLLEPEFVELLIDNPDSVLIIEDAENIIMDRRTNANSSVSNLLNISDGLLADFLNVQIVCTFNNPLTMVDSALLRKGRLIARYEFGKLGIAKAQRLSDHFGFNKIIDKPMTVAEIANQHEKVQLANRVEVIGFRRNFLEN